MNKKKAALIAGPSAFLAAITIWLMSNSCPSQEQAIINLATVIVGHGECSEYESILSDIESIAQERNFCDGDVEVSVDALPSGEWSNCDAACAIMGQEVFEKYNNALPENWSCKKTSFELAPIQEACRQVKETK